jgi:hypothetical protein
MQTFRIPSAAVNREIRRPVSQSMLDTVLRPYHPECRYLKEAWAATPSEAPISLQGKFSISNSFYIESTGHFNAVEANICLNQMAYLLFANFVASNDAHPFRDMLNEFDLEVFRSRQLSSMFIVSLSTKFRKALNGAGFTGQLNWTKAAHRMGLMMLNMDFSFSASEERAFLGDVVFAIVPR